MGGGAAIRSQEGVVGVVVSSKNKLRVLACLLAGPPSGILMSLPFLAFGLLSENWSLAGLTLALSVLSQDGALREAAGIFFRKRITDPASDCKCIPYF